MRMGVAGCGGRGLSSSPRRLPQEEGGWAARWGSAAALGCSLSRSGPAIFHSTLCSSERGSGPLVDEYMSGRPS